MGLLVEREAPGKTGSRARRGIVGGLRAVLARRSAAQRSKLLAGNVIAVPPLRPEAAFADPVLFRSWLVEAERSGRRVVGYRLRPDECPLATFAQEMLGVPDTLVGLRLMPPSPQGEMVGEACLSMPHASILLPSWCGRFLTLVDVGGGKGRPISPRTALDILERSEGSEVRIGIR